MLRICSYLVPILLLLAGAAQALDTRPTIAGAARFVDADTLDIGAVRIRVQGIDAPEQNETCTRADGSEWRCGLWATGETIRRFEGRHLVCHDLGQRSYDRVVGTCLADGEDIALALVRDGIAMACPRFANEHPHSRAYIDAEKEAAFAGTGLHAGPLNPRAGFCLDPSDPARVTGVSAPAIRAAPARDAPPHSDCAIKGNVNRAGERIYHLPGQRHYDDVRMNHPDKRWFCSEAEARAAGWRPARR